MFKSGKGQRAHAWKSTWVEVDVNNTNETLVSSRGSRDDP